MFTFVFFCMNNIHHFLSAILFTVGEITTALSHWEDAILFTVWEITTALSHWEDKKYSYSSQYIQAHDNKIKPVVKVTWYKGWSLYIYCNNASIDYIVKVITNLIIQSEMLIPCFKGFTFFDVTMTSQTSCDVVLDRNCQKWRALCDSVSLCNG